MYSKPTDSHLYFPFDSSHPAHCKWAVPYGVTLRLHRNCSSRDTRAERALEYKSYLRRQGYPSRLIEGKFSKAFNLERKELLKPNSSQQKKKIVPLVLDYNPRLPDIAKIINKHSNLIYSSNFLQAAFLPKSLLPTFRRTKNLKELLAPSKFRPSGETLEQGGCSKCSGRCDLCKNYLVETNSFQSFVTGRTYAIKEKVSCTSSNVVYLVSCKKCNLQYVGSVTTEFKVRFRNHKSHMRLGKKFCEVAVHFNSSEHVLNDFEFIIIEQIRSNEAIEHKLLNREAYWTLQLRCLKPNGLNKRCEYKSKHRIHYG